MAIHVVLAAALTEVQVKNIVVREGRHVELTSRRDRFSVMEMWISDDLVIECLTPDM